MEFKRIYVPESIVRFGPDDPAVKAGVAAEVNWGTISAERRAELLKLGMAEEGTVDFSKCKPQVSHLLVRRATRRWLLSPAELMRGITAGEFIAKDGNVEIKTKDGEPNVLYKIVLHPGTYCCHCQQALNNSREGAAHIKAMHAGVESPDDNNPSGWRVDNHYTLELVSGITPKPEVGALGRMRYLKEQQDRRLDPKVLKKHAKISKENAAKS